jgi:hypothetical protein
MEIQSNNAFLAFNSRKISDVTRTNTISSVTGNTIGLSADFTFIVDGVLFSGPGTWESSEVDNSLNIEMHFNLSNGTDELIVNYSCSGNISDNVQTETIGYTFASSYYSAIKTTRIIEDATSKSSYISSITDINGIQFNSTATIVESFISSNISNVSATYQEVPQVTEEPTKLIQVEYQLVTNSTGDSVATFTKYDINIDDVRTYTLGSSPSICTATTLGDNIYNINAVINLVDGSEGIYAFNHEVSNNINISELPLLKTQSNNTENGWSARECADVVATALIVYMTKVGVENLLIGTLGWQATTAQLVSISAAAAIGYTFKKWVEHQTSLENDSMKVQSLSSPSSAVPTLSQWKQIFFTLLMLSSAMGFMGDRTSNYATVNAGASGAIISNILVFDRRLFSIVMTWIGLVIAVGLAGMTIIFGGTKILDIVGALFCAPLVAYIVHIGALAVEEYRREEG